MNVGLTSVVFYTATYTKSYLESNYYFYQMKSISLFNSVYSL